MTEPKHVYLAIAFITEALAKAGISKDRKNTQQGFSFRGIDDVYNALGPLLAKHKVCILPRCLERLVSERETKSGGVLFSVTVAVEFDIVSAEDGSSHTVKMYGEAMDSGDKATNKAMSAAYKYMALEVFCIPTEGDNDADAVTHEVTSRHTERPTYHTPSGADDTGEITLPGTAKQFDGWGGKPLSVVPLDVLVKVGAWLHKKDSMKNALLVNAISEEAESRRTAEPTTTLLEGDEPA